MKNKGITLVALVITIIILLILAGIAISQLTDNGLFENIKIAKEQYENAKSREDNMLKQYENAIDTEEIINGQETKTETETPITVIEVLSSIAITKQPTKKQYKPNEMLDLTGIEITATYESGNTTILDLANITFFPDDGTVLSTKGEVTVTATYTENEVTQNATITVNVDELRPTYDSSNTLGRNAYNGNLNDYDSLNNNSFKYIKIDSDSYGSVLNICFAFGDSSCILLEFYDSNGRVLNYKGWCSSSGDVNYRGKTWELIGTAKAYHKSIPIPNNTVRVGIEKYNSGNNAQVYDIYLSDE